MLGNTIDYDKFGHCIKCHRNLIVEQIIDQKPTKRFLPDYSEKEYVLDDGSRMRVAVCKQCKETLTDKDTPYIMKTVIAGWKKELETLHHWTEEKKEKYMDKYGKLKIVKESDGSHNKNLHL